ncbi:uncharacterized protein PG986_014501 [Apiospora aurea]|uniref:Uncharacterized protein n=1 Tax=Apiospora aurea TaxID=335848 RepID=A0ABR1PT87_9PEZI
MAHTKRQKDKVRKSGLSLENKTLDLGRYCNVFSALAYWNPTHERWDTAMHVPRGQRVPDLNRIFRQSAACHARPSHGRATRSRRHAEAVDFETQPNASDDANADVDVDSDVDAEYESDPEYMGAAPVGAAEPLSVYDIIPDEDGGTVIPYSPHNPRRQVGVRQLPSPRRPQAGVQGSQSTVEKQPARSEPSSTTNATPTATNAGRPAHTRYLDHGAMDASLQRAVRQNSRVAARKPLAPILSTRPRQCPPRLAGNAAKSSPGRQGEARQNTSRCAPDYYKDYQRKLQRDILAKKMVGLLDDLRTSLVVMPFG